MAPRSPPRPLQYAVAHALAACGIVATIAIAWMKLPAIPTIPIALAAVGGIGGAAWFAARSTRRPNRAANDNDPVSVHERAFEWQPLVDSAATRSALDS